MWHLACHRPTQVFLGYSQPTGWRYKNVHNINASILTTRGIIRSGNNKVFLSVHTSFAVLMLLAGVLSWGLIHGATRSRHGCSQTTVSHNVKGYVPPESFRNTLWTARGGSNAWSFLMWGLWGGKTQSTGRNSSSRKELVHETWQKSANSFLADPKP